MEILKTAAQLKAFRARFDSTEMESTAKKVGLVPTMGALHKGHASLIEKAIAQNDIVIVSIFVNPTQFGAGEDLEKYPRTESADLKMCESLGVSAVFMPNPAEMYFQGEISLTPPTNLGFVLEGFSRPTHFSGVLSVVLKLLNLARPTNAYFGKKDAQQLLLIRHMVKTFFIPTNIIPCDIVRDIDGVALSSRNIYLSAQERKLATKIPTAINAVESAFKNGEKSAENLLKIATEILNHPEIYIFYAQILDLNLLKVSEAKKGESVLLLAVQIGSTRLLDNLFF